MFNSHKQCYWMSRKSLHIFFTYADKEIIRNSSLTQYTPCMYTLYNPWDNISRSMSSSINTTLCVMAEDVLYCYIIWREAKIIPSVTLLFRKTYITVEALLDGSALSVASMLSETSPAWKITTADVYKCLKQVKLTIPLYTFASWSELPSIRCAMYITSWHTDIGHYVH